MNSVIFLVCFAAIVLAAWTISCIYNKTVGLSKRLIRYPPKAGRSDRLLLYGPCAAYRAIEEASIYVRLPQSLRKRIEKQHVDYIYMDGNAVKLSDIDLNDVDKRKWVRFQQSQIQGQTQGNCAVILYAK